MVLDMVCFCCRNCTCEGYTIYRGYLMCEYCLDDWLNHLKEGSFWIDGGSTAFEIWCVQHKKELDEENKDEK